MKQTKTLNNITLQKGDDGYWLFLESDKGPAGINLSARCPGIIHQSIAAWAESQLRDADLIDAPPAAPDGEEARAYNAAVIAAITSELIGPVERGRLDKTPWARSIVTELLRRIANLRQMNSAATLRGYEQAREQSAKHTDVWAAHLRNAGMHSLAAGVEVHAQEIREITPAPSPGQQKQETDA